MHRISHPENFDPKLHRRTIRSSAKFCKDLSFFKNDNFYIVNYSDIPKSCKGCVEDLLHQDAYHIVFDPNCKFCRLNRFKIRADSKRNCTNLSNPKKSFMHQFVLIVTQPSVKNLIETNTSSMLMRKPHSNVITVKRLSLH